MFGPTLSFPSSHLSGLKTSASLPQIFLFLEYKVSDEARGESDRRSAHRL